MLTVIIISIVLILLIKLLNHFNKKLNHASYIKKIISKLLLTFEWKFIVGSLIQGTLDYVSFSNTRSVVGFSISIIISLRYIQILLMLSPIILALYVIKNHEKIKDGTYGTKYSIIYESLQRDQLEILLLNAIMITRRIIFGVSVILLSSSPYIQVIIKLSHHTLFAFSFYTTSLIRVSWII